MPSRGAAARATLTLALALAVGTGTLCSGDARADDGAAARDLVSALGTDAAHAPLLSDPLSQAREALERAMRLRDSGDELRAKAADGLALEWAETARDLARAADAERTAADRRREAMAKQAQVERARALVEAELAQVGRLRKEIDDAGGPGGPRVAGAERTAVEVHDGQGRKAPAKRTPKKPSADTPPAEAGGRP